MEVIYQCDVCGKEKMARADKVFLEKLKSTVHSSPISQ
jgi:hypothetical protein